MPGVCFDGAIGRMRATDGAEVWSHAKSSAGMLGSILAPRRSRCVRRHGHLPRQDRRVGLLATSRLLDVLIATAGLSECSAACSADNWPFYIGFALFVLFCVWITLSMFATVDVIGRRIGPRRSVTWVGIVWLVPIIGATAWRLSLRRARRLRMSTRSRIT